MKMLLRIVVVALTLLALPGILPGLSVTDFYAALIAALVLGVINLFVRPVLLILTLPLTILTLGLFTFVLNGLLLWLVASFVPGFEVAGFLTAFIAALLLTLVKWLVDTLLP
mgnify:CR=1 FL=1